MNLFLWFKEKQADVSAVIEANFGASWMLQQIQQVWGEQMGKGESGVTGNGFY